MEHKEEIGNNIEHDKKWVRDSSVDYKGRLPLRNSTGVWTASFFIISIEFSERLSYFGIAANLILYLIKMMHEDLKTAAKNTSYWSGVTTIMPLIGGFIADAYTGRFVMVLISSFIYLVGLSLLTMSQLIPSLNPCATPSKTCEAPTRGQESIFFLALYLLSIGTGGHKPCLESFGADQFDDNHEQERKKKMSYFNWWNFALCSGLVLGATILVYLEDNVGWGIAYLVLGIAMASSIVLFWFGRRFYRFRLPGGSPLTPMFQVLVAAFRKRRLAYPSSPDVLYETPVTILKPRGRILAHTNRLRFLDKAAIIEDHEREVLSNEMEKLNPWRLVTATKVEDVKLVISMIPIWLTALPFGICVAQAQTLFVKQSATMNRKLGPHFEIPAASMYSLGAIGMIISVTVYDKILVPILRRATGTERGISILKRIGIGMIFPVMAMSVAAVTERKRLRIAMVEGMHGNHVDMSVFWLAPQFLILGLGEGFTLVGLQEYFYDQVPDSMRSLGIAFYLSVIGSGHFLNSLLITIVDHFGDKKGNKVWIGEDLSSSRLDYFYWLVTSINFLNLCVYVILARRYTYKNIKDWVVV